MKIAYRRLSGKIGLTNSEDGERGAWVEKRVSFVKELERRGHKVIFISNLTKETNKHTPNYILKDINEFDVLIIEFGSNNLNFYKKDIEETIKLANEFNGKVIYLCDDPDLEYFWDSINKEKIGNWYCLVNAKNPKLLPHQPAEILTFDMPFHVFLKYETPVNDYGDEIVYMGRNSGRIKYFNQVLYFPEINIVVYGRETEWNNFKGIKLKQPVLQRDRKEHYKYSLACLVVADNKHKSYCWRTGRAYHALSSGCPVIAEFDNETFKGFLQPKRYLEFLGIQGNLRESLYRRITWENQYDLILQDKKIAEATFNALGI